MQADFSGDSPDWRTVVMGLDSDFHLSDAMWKVTQVKFHLNGDKNPNVYSEIEVKDIRFVGAEALGPDGVDYVVRMKNYLNNENVSYYSTNFHELADKLPELLAEGKENIIIPSSSTKTAFDRLVKKLGEMELDAYDIDLLGYPDWQTFADKEAETFKRYNCMFFTSFYNNPNSDDTYAFNRKFRATFGRDQFNTYPHYGMLGYDIANFFLMHMYIEGEDFAANIENLESRSLQNPLHFSHKNTWSGFVNNAMMFVRYNDDGTISSKQL